MTARELARWMSAVLAAAATNGCGGGGSGGGCGGEQTTFAPIDDATFNRLAENGIADGECDELCRLGGELTGCSLDADARGNPAVACRYVVECMGGRLTAGVCPAPAPGTSAGDWLARIASMEAASIPAFRRLERELSFHGAPHPLVRAARLSRADEVRHARTMRHLASRHGTRPPPVRVGAMPVRDVASLAAENAAEGCTRETYGALMAKYQARHAEDPAVRAAMRTIARDETRHAALSWRIHRWAERQLTSAQRAQVAAVRARAARMLEAEAGAVLPEPVRRELGLPSADEAVALARAIRRLG